MCGIAGVFDLGEQLAHPVPRREELLEMIARLGHRGPDEAGYLIDARVGMAAVRLSINDLEHGQQPMGEPQGRYWIVFNGEIYNHEELRGELRDRGHSFETRCDTEVALRAWMEWGEDAPRHFDGGFAFALHDRVEDLLWLVRDRFGKRPLFYSELPGSLVFASEIKALTAHAAFSLRWDPEGLAALFARWTPFGGQTPYAGVRQVPGGHILRVTSAGVSSLAYGGYPLAGPPRNISLGEAAEQTRALLTDAVRLRLRSDVEVGVLLSGGLDSSIITRLMADQVPGQLRAFSLGFEDPRFDESDDQARVAKAFGVAHETLQISSHDIAQAFGEALWHAEIPQFRTALSPMVLLSRFIRQHGIKVVLSGEGADEVFLGYNIFKEARLRAAWSSLTSDERRARLGRLYPYLPHFSAANLRVLEARFDRSSDGPDRPLFSHDLRFDNSRLARRLLKAELQADPLERATADIEGFADQPVTRRAQWIEMHTLLQGYLLSSQGDRMAFAHGVEPRCPFLSPPLVEWAAGLPEELLLSPDGDEKHLLKQAFGSRLPERIVAKPKQPYRAPMTTAFKAAADGSFIPFAEDHLAEDSLGSIDPVDLQQAQRFVTKLRNTPPERISPREDQAFVLLLSLSVLNRQMVHGERPSMGSEIVPPIVRRLELAPHAKRAANGSQPAALGTAQQHGARK